jgi:hypothetical protein
MQSATHIGKASGTSVSMVLWAVFLAGVPFYVLESGLPQPAYIVMSLLFASVAYRAIARNEWRAFASMADLYLPLAMFVLYVLSVSSAWYLYAGDHRMMFYPAYYLFNFVTYCSVVTLSSQLGSRFESFTAKCLVFTLLLQLMLVPFVSKPETIRQALFFNNPNQLGYYALLSCSILLVLREKASLPWTWTAVGAGVAALLCLVSLSRSAIGSLLLLLVLAFRSRPRYLIAGVAIAAVVLLVAWFALPEIARNRMFMSSIEIDDSFAGRGYDRIANHPKYLILGAGEGSFDRFDSFLDGEIHSSVGTLAFSYGIPGVVLMGAFIMRVVMRSRRGSWLLLMPALFYGLTHQGLRFAMLWVLLAVASAPEAARTDREP